MSIHGMIDERVRALLAQELAPLIERLEALEQQLRGTELVAGELRTAESGQPLPAVQWTEEDLPAPEPEPLPTATDPEPSKPVRRRAPRKTTAPEA